MRQGVPAALAIVVSTHANDHLNLDLDSDSDFASFGRS